MELLAEIFKGKLEKRKRNRVYVGVKSTSLRTAEQRSSNIGIGHHWCTYYFFAVPSFELANPEPRTIRRYGGSTSTENPWPEDEFADKGSLEAR